MDAETGDEVESADIIKGYPVDKNVYVTVDEEELEAIQIESTHTIEIDSFVPASEIDARFYESPYYIVPNDKVAGHGIPAPPHVQARGPRPSQGRSGCASQTQAKSSHSLQLGMNGEGGGIAYFNDQNVPSSILNIAGAFGFFTLIQLLTRPER